MTIRTEHHCKDIVHSVVALAWHALQNVRYVHKPLLLLRTGLTNLFVATRLKALEIGNFAQLNSTRAGPRRFFPLLSWSSGLRLSVWLLTRDHCRRY